MEYGKIIAVTGLPGLFELLSSKNDGAIVRSLEDKSTKFVSSRIHNFSHLETIEVFTVRDNVNLVDIFHAMEKDGGSVPDDKDAAGLKKYFQTVYPDLDFERVYASDLKKMIKWFAILKKNDVEIKLSEPEEAAEPASETVSDPAEAADPAIEAPAKAAPKKEKKAKTVEDQPEGKVVAKAEKKKTGEAGKEQAAKTPAKKTASKKSDGGEKPAASEAKKEQPAKEPAGKKAAPKKAAPKKK